MSHAWLIIAHNEFGILQQLISMLDTPECDFFIHIDKKVKSLPDLNVSQGRLFLIDNRIDVRWGHISQIETELVLLEAALDTDHYNHYHIISGTHLPLKPFAFISSFFENHSGEEIMRFWPNDDGEADFKLRRYHFPIRGFKSRNRLQRSFCQFFWKCALKIQKLFGIRHFRDIRFYKTDNWLSLTERAAGFLVKRKKQILRKYRWSFCGDEFFVASELKSAKDIVFRIFDCQNLLYADFIKDTPRTLTLNEIPDLSKSEYLFARKFSDSL